MARSRAKISGSSRVSPFDTYSNKPLTKGWLFKQLMRLVMWRADALTCVSEDMVGEYRTIFPERRHVRAYNIIDDEASRRRMAEPIDHPWFSTADVPVVITAGTLTERKGHIDLLRAVQALQKRGRPIRLAIFGEGDMRSYLEGMAKELGIADSVWFPGRIENPLRYFARARIGALSSYAEGLPNVLVEMMMCGCTPVSTDCPTGPRELLSNGRYGYLAPMHDPIGLADAIAAGLDRPIAAHLLAEAVRPFHVRAVLDRHFEILGIDDAGRENR